MDVVPDIFEIFAERLSRCQDYFPLSNYVIRFFNFISSININLPEMKHLTYKDERYPSQV